MSETNLLRSPPGARAVRHGLLLLALSAVACGTPVEPAKGASGSSGAVQFPHAAGYKAGTDHGAEALALGQAACNECHRPETNAPTCASCHEGYPHEEGWLAGTAHGVGLIGETGAAALQVCGDCHGKAELTAPSCTTCHDSYPHPEGWELAGQHGAYTLARGSAVAACGGCHGAALEGVTDPDRASPSCTSCHATWPHPEGWAAVEGHGATSAAQLPDCYACHGEGGTGGIVALACSRCHDAFPHADGWTQGHLAWVNARGDQACLSCHDAGSAAPTMPASCGAACHSGSGG
jgi:hypothetical protein